MPAELGLSLNWDPPPARLGPRHCPTPETSRGGGAGAASSLGPAFRPESLAPGAGGGAGQWPGQVVPPHRSCHRLQATLQGMEGPCPEGTCLWPLVSHLWLLLFFQGQTRDTFEPLSFKC